MMQAVDENLTRSIGVSNFSPQKITEWFSDARIYPAVNQVGPGSSDSESDFETEQA